jgi:hypothetical protein
MPRLRSQTQDSFAHVTNVMLRGVLESSPNQVKPAQMKQALRRTLTALIRDEAEEDPALYRALPARAEAARTAFEAFTNNRPTSCHRALRVFWSI